MRTVAITGVHTHVRLKYHRVRRRNVNTNKLCHCDDTFKVRSADDVNETHTDTLLHIIYTEVVCRIRQLCTPSAVARRPNVPLPSHPPSETALIYIYKLRTLATIAAGARIWSPHVAATGLCVCE